MPAGRYWTPLIPRCITNHKQKLNRLKKEIMLVLELAGAVMPVVWALLL